MSTKPKAARFFLRRIERPVPAVRQETDDLLLNSNDDGFGDQDFRKPLPGEATDPMAGSAPDPALDEAALAAIAAEGLTGRQLRRARLMAQKHGISFASDLDAVLQLRRAGIDPFAQTDQDMTGAGTTDAPHLVAVPGGASPSPGDPARALARLPGDSAQLPARARPIKTPSTETQAENSMVSEIQRMQQEIGRRRRKRVALLAARLFVFVVLPALFAGWYFYRVATPIYATHTEFVIQSAEQGGGGGGLGGLLAGTGLATSQDSITVQGYLQSREALLRLEKDLGFSAHFQNPEIDPLQRLEAGASLEGTYKVYKRFVKISFDPTEGLVRMEVMAADPETAAAWASQLIRYAEEQVDQLTQRMRVNQMADAQAGYDDAQAKLEQAQRKLIELQESFKILSSESEVGMITRQIAELESQVTEERLSLAQMESNANPNVARMEPIKLRIKTLEEEIALLRARMTESAPGTLSLAEVQGELLIAQAAVETRQMILAQALQTMELARLEAGRQTRYLSVSVSPTPPDEPAYPRAFENTLVTLLILIGIYLMVSMTAAILREQVSS
ncbi:MAG TPA: capsule biosynthesis protein [Tabrizicola sp.]|nr:capsule biosynthesis protein [Tabrizicola sp.]